VSELFRSGPWRLAGEHELFAELQDELEAAAHAARTLRGPCALGPWQVYRKASPLRLRPALRHALRRAAGLPLPRLAELENLAWLRAHGFRAARPLLAGVRFRAGLPRYQFLCTELVEGAATLEARLPGASETERAAWLAALARDLAALHGLGFVHRDLFLRNLLVALPADTPAPAPDPRCTFLDAWRGGARRGWRGPDHDLGCLFLEGASSLTRAEQSLFLTTYREESSRLGRALPRNWPHRVERARARLLEREARRHPGLAPAWRFPARGV
jgi:lipopolysaccharide kinase (Kdo/WaaP) family protein